MSESANAEMIYLISSAFRTSYVRDILAASCLPKNYILPFRYLPSWVEPQFLNPSQIRNRLHGRRGVIVYADIRKAPAPAEQFSFYPVRMVTIVEPTFDGPVLYVPMVLGVKAKLEGRPVPAAKGPMRRLQQRITYSTVLSVIVAAIGAFGLNTFHAQEKACAVPILQPIVSDVCGRFGFGGRPTKAERLAWQARRPGNCEDLRKHLESFPEGSNHFRAQGLLADRRVKETNVWTPVVQQLRQAESQGDKLLPNADLAKQDALARSQRRADDLCRGFSATTIYRFKSARPEAQEWDCSTVGKGVSCGFEGQAICQLDVKSTREEETCGG